MNKIKSGIAVLMVALSATTASAENIVTGNWLLRGLLDKDDNASSYIIGVAHAGRLLGTICQPVEATGKQDVDIVQMALESHPSTRHLHAAHLTLAALMNAWPCAKI